MNKRLPISQRLEITLKAAASSQLPVIFVAQDQETSYLLLEQYLVDNNIPVAARVDSSGAAIGIDAVRAIRTSTAALAGETHAAVICNADQFTPEAQNALLKSLEEPDSSIQYLINVSHSHTLLSTIISRAQIIEFTSPKQDQTDAFIHDVAQDSQISVDEVSSVFYAYGRSFGMTRNICADPDELVRARERVQSIKALINGSRYDKLAYLLKDASYDQALLNLRVMRAIYTELLHRQPTSKEHHQRLTILDNAITQIKKKYSLKGTLSYVALRI